MRRTFWTQDCIAIIVPIWWRIALGGTCGQHSNVRVTPEIWTKAPLGMSHNYALPRLSTIPDVCLERTLKKNMTKNEPETDEVHPNIPEPALGFHNPSLQCSGHAHTSTSILFEAGDWVGEATTVWLYGAHTTSPAECQNLVDAFAAWRNRFNRYWASVSKQKETLWCHPGGPIVPAPLLPPCLLFSFGCHWACRQAKWTSQCSTNQWIW